MTLNRKAIYNDGTPVYGECEVCNQGKIAFGESNCPNCGRPLVWPDLPSGCKWVEEPALDSPLDPALLQSIAELMEVPSPAPVPVISSPSPVAQVTAPISVPEEVAANMPPSTNDVANEAAIENEKKAEAATSVEISEEQVPPKKKRRGLFGRKRKEKEDLEPAISETGTLVRCPTCGHDVSQFGSAAFCPHCGTNLDVARETADKSKKDIKNEQMRLSGDAVAATTNELAGFQHMFIDGIAETETGVFSQTMKFGDINYEHERGDIKDDIYAKYSSLFASFPSNSCFQINLINFPVTDKTRELFYDEVGSTEKIAHDINEILAEWSRKGRTEFYRPNYISFALEADNDDDAARSLATFAESTAGYFEQLGTTAKVINGVDRAKLVHDLLCGNNEPFYLDYEEVAKKRKRKVRDSVVPGWAGYPSDQADVRSLLMLPHKYSKTFWIRDFGNDLSDRAIRTIRALPIPMNISLLFRPRPRGESIKKVRENINVAQGAMFDYSVKASKAGGLPDLMPPAMVENEAKANELLDYIQEEDQSIAWFQGFITIWAPTRAKLEEYEDMLMQEKDVWTLDIIEQPLAQEQALVSSLPLATPLLPKRYRSLSSAEGAAMVPFVSQTFDGDPANSYLLGTIRATGQVLFVNPDDLKSPHMWLFGITGGGKSMEMKTLIASLLLQYPRTVFDPATNKWQNPSPRCPQLFTFDFHEEYIDLGNHFGAQITYFGPTHDSCLNPLNLSDVHGELTLQDVHKNIDFFLALFEAMMDRPLSKREQSILDRNLNTIYAPHISQDSRPTLLDLYQALREDSGDVAALLADSLELFATGSMSTFAHQTNVETSPQWNIYVMSELGNTMQTLVMLSALQHVRQQTYANYAIGKPTYLIVEEVQKLFDNDAAVRVLMSYAAELRKYGLHLIFISQLPKAVLSHPLAEDLFENSGLFVFLPQQAKNAALLEDMFRLSPAQMDYIRASQTPGTGLVIADDVKIAFKNEIPQESYFYEITNTDPYRNAENAWLAQDKVKAIRGDRKASA